MDKKEARRAGLDARSALSASSRKQYSHRIFLKLKGRLDHVSSIGIYVSIQDEVETEEIIQYCFDHGIHVHVPKVDGKNIHFYEIHAFSDLIPGVWSIPEPYRTEPETDPSSIDWMLVPLSAFDAAHHRTGYGAGYYESCLTADTKPALLSAYRKSMTLKQIHGTRTWMKLLQSSNT